MNAITSFSDKPLVYILYLGAGISTLSFLFLAAVCFQKFFYGSAIRWPSVFGAIALFGGLTLSAVGTVGMYLAKILIEVKKRPYTLIRKRYAKRQAEKEEKGFSGRLAIRCEKEFSN